jgi:hypothetical protein
MAVSPLCSDVSSSRDCAYSASSPTAMATDGPGVFGQAWRAQPNMRLVCGTPAVEADAAERGIKLEAESEDPKSKFRLSSTQLRC